MEVAPGWIERQYLTGALMDVEELVRGRQLRHLHGAGAGWCAHHAGQQRPDEEVAEGWVLTCQAEPTTTAVTVEFEAL